MTILVAKFGSLHTRLICINKGSNIRISKGVVAKTKIKSSPKKLKTKFVEKTEKKSTQINAAKIEKKFDTVNVKLSSNVSW